MPWSDEAIEAAAKAIFGRMLNVDPDCPKNGWRARASGRDDMEFVRPRFLEYARLALDAADAVRGREAEDIRKWQMCERPDLYNLGKCCGVPDACTRAAGDTSHD